ncbi:hypothetical protein, partial [Nocardia sp. CC201C]|uniref:hypothetical protein n=1 Tax=Nocardia sp. CC201C TaxID=3044575 RepID=UPI0024A9B330
TRRQAPDDSGRTPDGPLIPGPEGRTARPNLNVFDRPILPASTLWQGTYNNVMKNVCTPWLESRQDGPSQADIQADENQPPKIEPFYPGWPKS